MKIDRIKLFAIVLFAIPLMLLVAFAPTQAKEEAFIVEDAAATYKAKCAMCHTPNAGKFFDPAKTDEEHIVVIMKGKKGEKPPFMPGYEAKGMTADEAKTLAAHMRTLKTAN